MPTIDVEIPTPDGAAAASLHLPGGDGSWPGVVMYPDAASTRGVFREMGERLAAAGYAVLVPDVYYRAGAYEPFSITSVFSDRVEWQRMTAMAQSLTADAVGRDAAAFADFLARRPEVADGPIGTTGYCMGGRLSLIAAGSLGDRVGAAASFHGGRLAVADDADSPHHLAPSVRAVVYVGAARNDRTFGEDQAALLHEAYRAAGVEHTIDHYAAGHGFAVRDNPSYDEAAAERHWAALTALFDKALH